MVRSKLITSLISIAHNTLTLRLRPGKDIRLLNVVKKRQIEAFLCVTALKYVAYKYDVSQFLLNYKLNT
jgi:hypothetical protein